MRNLILPGPTNSTGRCPGRHSPSFFHYGERMPRLCPVTTSKWKTSEVTGPALVFSSLLNVMQWAGSPPVSHFLQAALARGQVLTLHTLLHAAAVSCYPTRSIFKVSLQFNELRISKDRQKSVCLFKKKNSIKNGSR